MKFSMTLSRFLKDCCLEKILQEYPPRKVNSWIKREPWRKWRITMLSGFFGSKENPSFLPCHISDIIFITEVARKYNFWLHFFHEK
jgi:hypothetical protein